MVPRICSQASPHYKLREGFRRQVGTELIISPFKEISKSVQISPLPAQCQHILTLLFLPFLLFIFTSTFLVQNKFISIRLPVEVDMCQE